MAGENVLPMISIKADDTFCRMSSCSWLLVFFMQYEDDTDAKQKSQDLAEKSAFEELQVPSFFWVFSPLTLFDQTQPPNLLFSIWFRISSDCMFLYFNIIAKLKLILTCSSICLFVNQEVRRSLPIYAYREQLLKAVEEHQVIQALMPFFKSSNNRRKVHFTNPYWKQYFSAITSEYV